MNLNWQNGGIAVSVSAVNLQALVGICCFGVSIVIAKIILGIYAGRLPGNRFMVFYLRLMLGFLLAASVVFVLYSFAGKNILF